MMSIQMNASLEIECNKFWAAGTQNTTQYHYTKWIQLNIAKSIMKANECILNVFLFFPDIIIWRMQLHKYVQ